MTLLEVSTFLVDSPSAHSVIPKTAAFESLHLHVIVFIRYPCLCSTGMDICEYCIIFQSRRCVGTWWRGVGYVSYILFVFSHCTCATIVLFYVRLTVTRRIPAIVVKFTEQHHCHTEEQELDTRSERAGKKGTRKKAIPNKRQSQEIIHKGETSECNTQDEPV